MENHQPCFEQNWWLNGILCLLTIDYFTIRAVLFLYRLDMAQVYASSSHAISWLSAWAGSENTT